MNNRRIKNIFITGSGRSGTSMLAGIFNKAGYFYGDNLYPPRDANPKGFYEDEKINQLNEDILFSRVENNGGKTKKEHFIRDYYEGQMWLFRAPQSWDFPATVSQQDNIRELVLRKPFCYKDPRFCYTVDNWLELAENSVVLCVFREPAATVNSILRECRVEPYLYSLNIGVASAYKIWCTMYLRLLDAYVRHDNFYFINYDDVVSGEIISDLEELTGANIDRSFPEKSLQRSKPVFEADTDADSIYSVLLELSRDGLLGRDKNKFLSSISDLISNINLPEGIMQLLGAHGELDILMDLVSSSAYDKIKKGAEKELDKSRLEVSEKEKALDKSRLEMATKEKEIIAKDKEVAALNERITILLSEYEQAINAYELSMSWRLTYPLRWLKKLFSDSRK